MTHQGPTIHVDGGRCVDDIIDRVGKNIVFGMPLALGKPNHLANALYRRAKLDPSIQLTIMTALSLEVPNGRNELEKRLLDPMVERIWKGFVDFDYVLDLRHGCLPPNISLSEFFTKAGSYIGCPYAQQNYISSNYTHVIRDLMDNGLNVIGNLIAKRSIDGKTCYSMSCNSDLTVEGIPKLHAAHKNGRPVAIVGQVNKNLPFMYGDAVMAPNAYDLVLDHPDYDFPLYSAPKSSVAPADHMIGVYVSSLVPDGGTLQIGIGSLGDAIAAGLIMRHRNNADYRGLLGDLEITDRYAGLIKKIGDTGVFKKGLYGATEMLVDSFLELYRAGILKRKVYDHEGLQEMINTGRITENVGPAMLSSLIDAGIVSARLTRADFDFLQTHGIFKDDLTLEKGAIHCASQTMSADLSEPENFQRVAANCLGLRLKGGALCHGAFFIGPQSFYEELRNMDEEERKQFSMTGVNYINQLYGNERLKSLQRKNGRFVNAGMMVTLLGAVVSDCLECGNVISGVGGQYNFVSMAHALEDGRLIMMARSTRNKGGRPVSNIVFNYGHTTIPRHMRDIVVTEYGIADLRGKKDSDVIRAMLSVADSRFQEELLRQAKRSGKLPADEVIPDRFRQNLPEALKQKMEPYRAKGFFHPFPFGTDYTQEEIVLGKALKNLKNRVAQNKLSVLPGIMRQLVSPSVNGHQACLERMGLGNPTSLREKVLRAAVTHALSS